MITLTEENAECFADYVQIYSSTLYEKYCKKETIEIEIGSELYELWVHFDEEGG